MKSKFCLFLLFFSGVSFAQHRYVAPKDSLVIKNLESWKDMKFGLFMHWGPYCQWGVVESWSLCPEDEGWTQRTGPYSKNYFEYKRAYENLQTTFNPTDFDAQRWVDAAWEAGMRYVVFTTKHHDGFCMFNTKQTDYKITDSKTPYSSNPRSNITLEIFNAFRARGFTVGAYFSKPDWHCESYWWPYFPPKDRNANYDPKKYPERWNDFKDFTYNQIRELMSEYGKVDILWLDGGWVRPLSTVDRSIEWQRGIIFDQDIDMERIATMARSFQPGLIIVDRSVTGEFENYTTPEQEVPKEPLPYPWETCMTMGNSWSFVPGDAYKTAHQLIHLLIKVVSRGGNFLLNIGPGPDGDWDPIAYQRLKEIGDWMKINNSGIYNSIPVLPYSSDNIFFTQSKDKKTVYAFFLNEEDEVQLTGDVVIKGFHLNKGSRISIPVTCTSLKWKSTSDGIQIEIPSSLLNKPIAKHALAFVIKPK